jgi:hypothetical protein
MDRELELLRELEGVVRERGAKFYTGRCRAPWFYFADLLMQLDVLRGEPKMVAPLDRSGPKRLWCVCGHHRHDHRRYDAKLRRDGSCLEDDCGCEEFRSCEAMSCRAVG